MQNYKTLREHRQLIVICLYLYSCHLVGDVIYIIINLYKNINYSLYYSIILKRTIFLPYKILCITYDNDIDKLEIIEYIKYHYKNLYIFTKSIKTINIKVIVISTTSIHHCYEYYHTTDNIVTDDEFIKLCSKQKHYSFDSYRQNNQDYLTLTNCNKLVGEHLNRLYKII